MGRKPVPKVKKMQRLKMLRARALQMTQNRRRKRRATQTSAAEPAEQSALEPARESPPAAAAELAGDTPDASQQQATQEAVEPVEPPKPLPRLRQRPPPPPPTRLRGKDLRSVAVADERARLAALVRAQPVLYNRECAHFGERAHAHYAWAYISRRMLRPESECISMWQRLKDRYRAAIIRQKRMSEQGLEVKPSRHDKYMSFLKPYLYIYKKITAADEAPACGPPPRAPRPPRPPRPPRVPLAPRPPRNTLVELFRNLGETVKAFPDDMKNRVKSEVFKVISDARELVLRNNSVEQLFIIECTEDIKEEPMEVNVNK